MNSDVQDRKIRQIVEALDGMHDYKQALKQCNAAIKQVVGKGKGKMSDCQWFVLLKADANTRLGKEDEAVEGLLSLAKMELLNDRMIRRALQVCSSVNRMDLGTEMVAKAVERNAGNQHLEELLFLCYAMERRFKDQQAYAMRLMKAHPKEARYFFYVAVSMALQAPPDAKGHMLLMLAERWMDKANTEGRIKRLEELLFFTQVCERQGNYEKALELVQANEKLMKKREDCLALQADYMRALGRKEEQKALILSLLREHDHDNWGYVRALFDLLLPVDCEVAEEPQASVVAELEEAVAALRTAAGRPTRTGLMAGLELYCRRMRLHRAGAAQEEAREALLDGLDAYFAQFGAKSVCFADMDYFVQHLPVASKEALVGRLEEALPKMDLAQAPAASENGNKEEVGFVYRCACVAKLRVRAGMALDEARAMAVYQWGLAIPAAADLESTDRQFGDDLLLLVAHAHVSRYLANRSDAAPLAEAQALLEYGLVKSTCNFHLKLLQMRCHIMAGAFPPALRLLESLDVKNLQMDSVTHVVLDGALHLRTETETVQLFGTMMAFYTKARGETPRLVCLPYQEGSYSKVGEFYEFLDMLHHSLQAAVLKVERGFFLLSMVSKCTLASYKEVLQAYRDGVPLAAEELAQLKDTRDNSAFDGWHDLAALSSGFRFTCADPAAEGKDLLRLRAATFHLIAAAFLEETPDKAAELLAVVQSEAAAAGLDGPASEEAASRLQAACWAGMMRLFALVRDVPAQVAAIQGGEEEQFTDCCARIAATREELEKTWADVVAAVAQDGALNAHLLPAATCFVTQLLSWTTALSLRWVEICPKRAPKSATPALRKAQTELKNSTRVLPAALIQVAETVQATLAGWQADLSSGALRLAAAEAKVPAVLEGDSARVDAGDAVASMVAAQVDGVNSTLAGLARVAGAVASCKKG